MSRIAVTAFSIVLLIASSLPANAMFTNWTAWIRNETKTCAWITVDAGNPRKNRFARILKAGDQASFAGSDDVNIQMRAQFYSTNDCKGSFVADRYDNINYGASKDVDPGQRVPYHNAFVLHRQGDTYLMFKTHG
jgi:hypothetical protein